MHDLTPGEAALQNQAEYLWAREALLRLHGLGTPEAGELAWALHAALGNPEPDAFPAMVALTRQAEAL